MVNLIIANGRVHRVLRHKKLYNILFTSTYQRINIGGANLEPIKTPLYVFMGECVHTEGVIKLPVTFREESTTLTHIVNFLVVNQHSAYNTIISQTTVNTIKAIVSTYHLMMKIPVNNAIRAVKGD